MRINGLSALFPAVFVASALVGCHGTVGSRSDGGTNSDGAAGVCTLAPVLQLWAARCTSSGCHGTGGQFPELTLTGVQSGWVTARSVRMPDQHLIVPGDPSSSWMYKKLTGMQGPNGGALMPLGASTPIDEASVIADWIRAGAPTQCDGDAGNTPPPAHPDPNALNQDALFTCTPGPGSSPARIRRIDQPEWTHAVGKPLTGTWWGSTAYQNPFLPLANQPYSTYSSGVTIDPATLDLYMLVLPEAPANWDAADVAQNHGDFIGGFRIYPVYDNVALSCIYNDVAPTDGCIDHFVDSFLSTGVLSRAPNAGERSRFRAFLVSSIADEHGDVTQRQATLLNVGQAAWLTSGALFRPEIGEPVPNDPTGRSRLTNDELALAIGSVLSTHRPGSGLTIGTPRPGDPDWATPENGWLQQIRAAADDGTIQDPAVMRRLIATYQGGIDPARHDLDFDNDSRRIALRGEYWLAPRIAGFFREWLHYDRASSVFKDTPSATSQFQSLYHGDPLWDPTTEGYGNLQSTYYGYESTLVQQLDDTIARTVIDAATSHEDVFHALMTTRLWHLASNATDTNGVTCTTNADCTAAGFDSCTAIGVCGNSISGSTTTTARPYNITGIVPSTPAGRWVQMPANERSGVLTHPAWLASYGGNFEDDPSIVHRGRWVRQNLLCQSVPGLELVMVEARLVATAPNLSARDRVHASIETGTLSPTCMGCHGLMNTLGYPFEMYNHAGFVRVTDHMHMPDGSSTITNAPDPALNRAMMNAVDFAQSIAGSAYARRCFIRQAFRYFAGRDETIADSCTLAAMEQALNHGSFFDMLTALVTSDTFLYRSTGGGTP